MRVCVCTMCVHCSHRPEYRDLLELELEVAVSLHVGTGNLTWSSGEEELVLLTTEPSLAP